MSDICFDINYMNSLQGDLIKAEGSVKDYIYSFSEMSKKLENELSSFNGESIKAARTIYSQISEIRDMISEINGKITDAKAKKQNEIEIPPRPSIPANATQEQASQIMSAYNSKVSQIEAKNAKIRAENQKIDEFVSKCTEAKAKLEELIPHLRQLEEQLKSQIEHTVSQVHSSIGQVRGICNEGSFINSAMSEFNYAFGCTYTAAEALYMYSPHSISGYSFMDKQFVIKNTHSHILGSGAGFFGASGGASSGYTSSSSADYDEDDAEEIEVDEEITVRDRDEDTFLSSIKGYSKIKMPSVNLHKLGGKKFISKMNQLGYEIVTKKDGTFIDSNGMISWEKR